ncbi:SPOR domain-containing protein [[Eubacterium] hominis]|uniref:SPOR domain-containing protein n=1 Tax=[Eubacterium] hominis TaxID=2764325 RepID=UPI003A4E074E
MNQKRVIMITALIFSMLFTGFYYLLFSYTVKNEDILHKTLYMNQVGLYKQEDTMKEMMEKLKKNGIDSYTWKQGDVTAVVCYISTNIDDTKNGQDKLTSLKLNYIQKTAQIESNEVAKLIDEKKYQEVLERIAE